VFLCPFFGVFVCIYIYICIHKYVYLYIYIYIYVHFLVISHLCVCVPVFFVCLFVPFACVFPSCITCVFVYAREPTSSKRLVPIHVCMYVYIHTYIYDVYIHMCMYIYIHTRTHTQTGKGRNGGQSSGMCAINVCARVLCVLDVCVYIYTRTYVYVYMYI